MKTALDSPPTPYLVKLAQLGGCLARAGDLPQAGRDENRQTDRPVHAARQCRHQSQPQFPFPQQGADLGLAGTITLLNAPKYPLCAVGNVCATEGSTQAAFGRKLGIENSFFTVNGPVTNPGINILAARRITKSKRGTGDGH